MPTMPAAQLAPEPASTIRRTIGAPWPPGPMKPTRGALSALT
jgi:hypothetical protein